MAATNVQAFSGDVQIRGTTFIKANTNTDNLAIGTQAGETSQGTNAVAIGYQAGETSQSGNSVAVGRLAGQSNQDTNSVAVGGEAGKTDQGQYATAVGYETGLTDQGNFCTAVGSSAGKTSQAGGAVAVGRKAGETSQGASSVAIGNQAGTTSQPDNSIILNATGSAFNPTTASSFHVKPVRGGNFAASALAYTADGEIVEETGTHFDASGNVGIGTTNPLGVLSVIRDTVVGGATTYQRGMFYKDGKLQITPPDVYDGYPLNGDFLTTSRYSIDGTTDYTGVALGVQWDGITATSLYFKTATDASTLTERMRITGDGNVGIGITNPPENLTVQDATIEPTFGLRRGNYNDYVVYMKNTTGNFITVTTSDDTVLNVGKGTGTNRSINALGTINASGEDYAEYMKKSRSDLVIKKGDIIGINNDGELTNVFSESIQFVVKSTNPSYVGGDSWKHGTVNTPKYPSVLLRVDEYSNISSQDANLYTYWEEQNLYANTEQLNVFYEENEKYLEDKNIHRDPYDRIAYCGQVPVNVYNTTPGQYVIPKQTDDDTISYELTNTPTFEQYQISIGKVIKIQEDGRAFIIVKIS